MAPSPAAPAGPPGDDLWIVLPHLGPGGAQKVAVLAAAHFAAQGLRVRLITLLPEQPAVHPIPAGVEHIDLGPLVAADRLRQQPWVDVSDRSPVAIGRRVAALWLGRLRRRLSPLGLRLLLWLRLPLWPPRPGWRGGLQRLLLRLARNVGGPQGRRLRELVLRERPRRLLALLSRTNMLSCLAVWDQPVHLVVSERNDPRLQHLPFPWNRLRPLLYARADVVTANTTGVLAVLRTFPGPFRRLELLANPLPATSQPGALVPLEAREREFLTVCRLVPQKGVDVLLQAFGLLPPEIRRSWRLRIVGDGPEREALEQQARQLAIADRVVFEGFQADPPRFFRRAPIFVLPSRFEGMPNALLEAMGFGLAPVVSDASPGPLELVESGVTGLVVPAGEAAPLAAALQRLVEDPALRQRCGAAAAALLRQHDWPALEPVWRELLQLP
ncbi:MAG: glycosyltransferase [Synechococcus sp.]